MDALEEIFESLDSIPNDLKPLIGRNDPSLLTNKEQNPDVLSRSEDISEKTRQDFFRLVMRSEIEPE